MIDSLFNAKGTADGFYRKRRNGVMFFKPDGEPFAFLVANKYGERFFVTCSKVSGKTWFSYALTEADEKRIGLSGATYRAKIETAERVWNGLSENI